MTYRFSVIAINVQIVIWSPSHAVVLLAFTESEYTTSEDMATVDVCVEVMQGPTGGLECNISVTLGIQDGLKAGKT